MSNWINGKELMAYWDIKGFELFDCLKKGLRPYTPHGQNIIDTDTLEHGREHSIEWYEGLIRGGQETGAVITGKGFSSTPRLTEQEIKQEAKKVFESEPLKPLNPPPHHMSFTLPNDNKKATAAIIKVMGLKFRRDGASEYAKKHGYRRLGRDIEMSIGHKGKTEDLTSPSQRVPFSATPAKKNIPASEDHVNAFILKGDFWSIYYDGNNEVNLKNLERIRYIAFLIEYPNQSFSLIELKGLVKRAPHEIEFESEKENQEREKRFIDEGLNLRDLAIETLSDKDKDVLEDTMYKLWKDVMAAKDTNSEEKIAEAQQPFDKMKTYMFNEYGLKVLHSSKGLSFRQYAKLSKEHNKLRSGVTGQINKAIKDIMKPLPKLGKHLDAHIKRGMRPVYQPPPGFPQWNIEWNS